MQGPRIFGIAATDAPVVAVIRRGPSSWCATGRWDTTAGIYAPGSWIRATVYPQRCDLSPDGRWLSAFVLNQHADWAAGAAYVSLSRLPWLTALAAWGIGSTWTNGVHFLPEAGTWLETDPDVGDPTACRERYGLAWTHAASFAVERRRGWSEAPSTQPRDPDDAWDQRREVTMEKAIPNQSHLVLRVRGWYAAFRAFGRDHFGESAYWLEHGVDRIELADVQWADWSHGGGLLVATKDGRLQVRTSDGQGTTWEHDLSRESPDPTPPPPEASRW